MNVWRSITTHMPSWYGAQAQGLFNKVQTWTFIMIQFKNAYKCHAWTLGIFMLIIEKKDMWAS
jgi:hypothetical protein